MVLRNGLEIGRSAIALDDHDGEVHVLTLSASADGAQRWLYAGLPGREAEAGAELSAAMLGRLRAPHPFYVQVRDSLKPGDTVVITPAPIGAGSVGRALTVMDALDEPTVAP